MVEGKSSSALQPNELHGTDELPQVSHEQDDWAVEFIPASIKAMRPDAASGDLIRFIVQRAYLPITQILNVVCCVVCCER